MSNRVDYSVGSVAQLGTHGESYEWYEGPGSDGLDGVGTDREMMDGVMDEIEDVEERHGNGGGHDIENIIARLYWSSKRMDDASPSIHQHESESENDVHLHKHKHKRNHENDDHHHKHEHEHEHKHKHKHNHNHNHKHKHEHEHEHKHEHSHDHKHENGHYKRENAHAHKNKHVLIEHELAHKHELRYEQELGLKHELGHAHELSRNNEFGDDSQDTTVSMTEEMKHENVKKEKRKVFDHHHKPDYIREHISYAHGEREITNIVDMAKQIHRHTLPFNSQFKEELQPMKELLKEKENDAAGTDKEAMRNTRKLMEAIEVTLDTKNSGDKLQYLIAAVQRVSERTTSVTDPKDMMDETKEFFVTLKDFIMELTKSRHFRKALLELLIVMKEIIGYEEKENVHAKRLFQKHFVNGHTKRARTKIKARTVTAVKELSEDHKKEIREHLIALLMGLREHPNAATAFRRFLRLGSLLNKELSAHLSRSQVDKDVAEIEYLATDILQSFAREVDINNYLCLLKKAISQMQKDRELQLYLTECTELIDKAIQDRIAIDDQEYIASLDDVIKHGRAIVNSWKEEPIYHRVVRESRNILMSIRSDDNLIELQNRAAKFLDSITYKTPEGKTHIDTSVLVSLQEELIPFFLERIKEIHIPGMRVDNHNNFKYLEFHDLYMTLGDILPDHVTMHTESDTISRLGTVFSRAKIRIELHGLRPIFKDFYFSFKRRGVIKMSDEGRADLMIKGNGLSIQLLYDLKSDKTGDHIILGRHATSVIVDMIEIDVKEAEHKLLLNFITTLFASRIRYAIQSALEDKINQFSRDLVNVLNKNVITAIPTIKARVRKESNKL